VTVEGAVLSRNGAVTLDTNTISRPGCATPVTGVPVVLPPDVVAPPVTPVTPPVTPPVSPPSSSPVPTPPTASSPASASGAAGTTYGQVGRVPVGAVDTGDGSTS